MLLITPFYIFNEQSVHLACLGVLLHSFFFIPKVEVHAVQFKKHKSIQDLTKFSERTTDLQIRNTLFMPLVLFYEFLGITQQPYGSFPPDNFLKNKQKTNQTEL